MAFKLFPSLYCPGLKLIFAADYLKMAALTLKDRQG